MALKLKGRTGGAFGISMHTLNRRDEEMQRIGDPDEEARQRELIQKMQAEIERLKKIIDTMRSERRQPSKSTGKRKSATAQQPTSVSVDGVEYVNVAWITRRTGLDQSSISRQIARLGIKPLAGMHATYIPKAQAENIQRKKRRR